MNKYSLRESHKVIEYMNKYHKKNMIPDDIIEDIDIEPYGSTEFKNWQEKWKNIQLKIIKLVDEENKEYTFEVPDDIKVR
jgi:hypothetical protein